MKKGKNREKKSGCKRRRYLALAGALFLLPLCLSHLPSRRLELTFLDVGQGDSCFLRTPEGITALIDGGSSDEKEIGFYTIGPFLDSQAVGTVDLVFASHGDSDHMNGIEELLLENRVGALLLPKNWRTREKLAGLGELAKKQGIPVYGIAAGDRITAGALTLTCLWPEEEPGALEENEASMVLWGSYGEFDVLFTGDLEGEGEESVLRNMAEGAVRGENKIPEAAGSGKPDSLKAGKGLEILKVSHHGSGGASSEAFLERVRPVYGVISCGRNNRYGHPAQETLKRLADKDCHVIRTDLSGAVTVRTDGKRYAVSAFFSSDSRK